jgi:hypothetical protein
VRPIDTGVAHEADGVPVTSKPDPVLTPVARAASLSVTRIRKAAYAFEQAGDWKQM